MDMSPPLDIDIDQLRDELGLGEIQRTLRSSQFDPSGDFLTLTGAQLAKTAYLSQITLESSEFLPSIFEETETVGPDDADAIAQRVNDAVTKTPLDTKFKELQNCQSLCVPKVNLELWHDLPRSTKTKDLGLKEIQKNLVKSAQQMIQLLDIVLRLQNENRPVEASRVLPLIADACSHSVGTCLILNISEATRIFSARYCSCISVGV